MERYKRIILAIHSGTLEEGTSLLDEFIFEIRTRFLKMINSDVVFTEVEIFVSKIIDVIIKNLDNFVYQAKTQTDDEFDRWFSVWLFKTINNYVKKYIRFCKIRNKILNNNNFGLEDNIPEDDYDILSSMLDQEFFTEFIKCLNEQEMDVVKLKLENYNQKQIAEMLGVSEATVSRTMDTLRAKLKKFLKIREIL